MTDEELISYRDDVREFMIAENEADTRIFQDVSKELISRLARGRKAIEAMENFRNLLDELKGMDYIVRNLVYCPQDRAYTISEIKIHADKDASNLIKKATSRARKEGKMSETGQDLEGSLKCYMKMYDNVFRENHDLRAQLAEAQKENERLREITSTSMGVGPSADRLFVHGDYESIKACQKFIFRMIKAEAENAILKERLEESWRREDTISDDTYVFEVKNDT